jgi:hypothetical protein
MKHFLHKILYVVVFTLCITIFTGDVFAADQSVKEQAEELEDQVVALGDLIAANRGIDPLLRIDLLGQLLTLSQTIVSLRQAAVLEELDSRTTQTLDRDGNPSAGTRPVDIDLVQVNVYFDTRTGKATMVEHYLTDSDRLLSDPFSVTYKKATTTVTLNALRQPIDQDSDNFDFARLSNEIRVEVAEILLNKYNFTTLEPVVRIIRVSGKNPLRLSDRSFRMNSANSSKLFEDFGARSQLRRATLTTGDGKAELQVISDQDEQVIMRIARNGKYEFPDGSQYSIFRPLFRNPKDLKEHALFDYTLLYYATTKTDSFNIMADRQNQTAVANSFPKVIVEGKDADREEVLDFVNSLFEGQPFTGELVPADLKLLDFLVYNDTNAVVMERRDGREPVIPQCHDIGDVKVVQEYLLQVLSGFGANYLLDELDLSIVQPTSIKNRETGDGFSSTGTRCNDVNIFFD